MEERSQVGPALQVPPLPQGGSFQGRAASSPMSLVWDAMDVVTRHLAALPWSPQVEHLRARADRYRKEASGWVGSAPGGEDRNELVTLVLDLHITVRRLERGLDADRGCAGRGAEGGNEKYAPKGRGLG